ncbi:unnamed protein product [Prunus brigantina]
MKLGFLYFDVFVLLGSEKHVHIDMRYLKLSEDLEEFQKYPWGIVSYAKTNTSLLRALCADYHRVKLPQKTTKTKKSEKKSNITASGRPRKYRIKGFGFTLQVDVQFLRPTLINKQQPYWTWGDNDENTEEIVELFADETQENTNTFVEEKYEEVEETATLPLSSKLHYNCMQGKLSSTKLRTLKREFQTTKDELAKVASSNRALRKRVRDLKEMVQNESLKHEDATVEKQDVKGKWCKKKRLATTLLSPCIDPSRKKRTITVLDAEATPPCFHPTKSMFIDDVKAVIDFCTAWKTDLSAEVQLKACLVSPDFFYKLIDDT